MGREIETKCIHLESEEDCIKNYGAISYPIYQTSTYAHPGVEQSTGYDYSRLQNPTREHLEKIIATLENGNDAFAFSSGMAAITMAMELFKPGDHLIVDSDLYGGSIRLFRNVSEKNGITFSRVDCYKEDVEAYVQDNTKAIYIETPTNPMMNVRDISNPKGTFDVNQMTNEEFINYANRIITRVESVGEGKEKQETAQGVDDGMLITKEEYENICKNSLGRSEVYDVDAVNQVNDGMVRFWGRDFDTWYDIWDAQLLQDIDGNITITGTLRNCIPEDRLRYSYKATGHADDNSELGIVIDKMEVMDYQKDDTTFSTQRLKQIQRRLGIPDSVNALSSVCLDDDYMSGLGKVLHVEYKVNDNTVGEADVDVVTGELEKNIIPYNVSKADCSSLY